MKVLVAARVPGTDAHEVIQAHRLYLVELMQQWTRLKRARPGMIWAWRWWWMPSCSGWTR